jgi:hypothetical protein
MWDAAYQALACATELIVFGFSFPDSDSEVSGLVRKALADNRVLTEVMVIDVDPDPVCTRLRKLLPATSSAAISPYPATRDFDPPAWWLQELAEAAR